MRRLAGSVEKSNISHVVIPLERSAISFCYYSSAPEVNEPPQFITCDTIESALDLLNTDDLVLHFVYGRHPVPDMLRKFIETTNHVKIAPLGKIEDYYAEIIVIEKRDFAKTPSLPLSKESACILRVEKADLSMLPKLVRSLYDKCARISVILLDIEKYTDADFITYATGLDEMRKCIIDNYCGGEITEVDILSDRLVISEMKNCNAGINHVTVSIDGSFHLCPGFIGEYPDENIGDLTKGLRIRNPELLDIENAPICAVCDAFQCKRCFYLNLKGTSEINTPTKQQCVLSHLERNCTQDIGDKVRNSARFGKNILTIPAISYLDPFELLKLPEYRLVHKKQHK
jgi:CXXX repeat peptide maturase